jgi:hypothetical protein
MRNSIQWATRSGKPRIISKARIYMTNATFPFSIVGNGFAIRQDVANLNKGGQFFTVVFEKADGKLRTMNCRTGVKLYLKGGSNNHEKYDNLLTVYDVKSKAYRSINFAKVKEIRSNGNRIIFK